MASTAGAPWRDRDHDAFMKVVCIAPSGRSGYAARRARGRRPARRRGAGRARRRQGAARPGEPAALEPGEHTVVMEPHAVGELLEMLGESAFNGLAHAEGRGALVGPARAARGRARR